MTGFLDTQLRVLELPRQRPPLRSGGADVLRIGQPGNQTYDEYTSRVDYDLTRTSALTVRSFIDKYVSPPATRPGTFSLC